MAIAAVKHKVRIIILAYYLRRPLSLGQQGTFNGIGARFGHSWGNRFAVEVEKIPLKDALFVKEVDRMHSAYAVLRSGCETGRKAVSKNLIIKDGSKYDPLVLLIDPK